MGDATEGDEFYGLSLADSLEKNGHCSRLSCTCILYKLSLLRVMRTIVKVDLKSLNSPEGAPRGGGTYAPIWV